MASSSSISQQLAQEAAVTSNASDTGASAAAAATADSAPTVDPVDEEESRRLYEQEVSMALLRHMQRQNIQLGVLGPFMKRIGENIDQVCQTYPAQAPLRRSHLY